MAEAAWKVLVIEMLPGECRDISAESDTQSPLIYSYKNIELAKLVKTQGPPNTLWQSAVVGTSGRSRASTLRLRGSDLWLWDFLSQTWCLCI